MLITWVFFFFFVIQECSPMVLSVILLIRSRLLSPTPSLAAGIGRQTSCMGRSIAYTSLTKTHYFRKQSYRHMTSNLIINICLASDKHMNHFNIYDYSFIKILSRQIKKFMFSKLSSRMGKLEAECNLKI